MSNEIEKQRPRSITLGIYPVTAMNQNEITQNLEKNCQVHNLPNIEPLIQEENIGILNLKDLDDGLNILKNYRKAGKNLVIASIEKNFVINNFSKIKSLQNILNDKQNTIDLSSIVKRLNQKFQPEITKFSVEKHISDIIFIVSIIAHEQRDKIGKIIFDDNDLSNNKCLKNVPFYFDNLKEISIANNQMKKVILGKSKGIRILKGKSRHDDDDSINDEENKSQKDQKTKLHQNQNDQDSEGQQSQKVQNSEAKHNLNNAKQITIESHPPLPILNSRFSKCENEDEQLAQDQHFTEMMNQLFDPNVNPKYRFYDQTAVFSFTISEKVASEDLPLYQFLKANECNLINVSNDNNKWIGKNLFFDEKDIFPNGMIVSNIEILPTVCIGYQLYSVVVATAVSITYEYLKKKSTGDLCAIHTFTIQSDGGESSSQILSHQIFFYK